MKNDGSLEDEDFEPPALLDTLKFVRGAVSDTETGQPILTHFCIYKNRIQGFNGRIAIDAECKTFEGIDTVVHADRFLKAIDICENEPTIRTTEGGKLVIERKPFRAQLATFPLSDFPLVEPSKGKRRKIGQGLIPTLRQLRRFIGGDALAGRRWTNTILFTAGRAYATNNAMLATVQQSVFPSDVVIPVYLVEELIRIDEPPTEYIRDDTGITFYWNESVYRSGSRWLKGQNIMEDWPMSTIVNLLDFDEKLKTKPEGLSGAIDQVRHFCPKDHPVIYFQDNKIATVAGENLAEVDGFNLGDGSFHVDNILPMLEHADKILIADNKGFFAGDGGKFKGIMIGLRTR